MIKIPKVITVASSKGGVGKSTISCNLAVQFAADGYSVELLDADPQGSAINFRHYREKDDIIASSNHTTKIYNDVSKKPYDIVIIDAGGRDSQITRSAIAAATYGILLIPFLSSPFDAMAFEDTLEILQEARAYTDIPAYAVFNLVDVRTKGNNISGESFLTELKERYDFKVLSSMLHFRIDFKNSIKNSQGVLEYKGRDNKAKEEMQALYDEIKTILHLPKSAGGAS